MLLFSRSRRIFNPIRYSSTVSSNHTLYPTLSNTPFGNFIEMTPGTIQNFLNTLTKKEQNYIYEKVSCLGVLLNETDKHITKITPRIKYLGMKIDSLYPTPNLDDLENILKYLNKAKTCCYSNDFLDDHKNLDVITAYEKMIGNFQLLNDALEVTNEQINKIAEEKYCLLIPFSIEENDSVSEPMPNINYTCTRTNIRTSTNTLFKNKIIYAKKYI